MREGIILSGVGGLYEVMTEEGVVKCKARGIFRKEGITPLLGDRVRISEQEYIEEILPRKNQLIRPAVANMDQVLFVFALHEPEPNWIVLERFLLEAKRRRLPAVICVNKMDLAAEHDVEWQRIRVSYRDAGYALYEVSAYAPETLTELRQALRDKITVVAGPSGVGKSSLINQLVRQPEQEVGELSRKISRGKNTTRHARLLALNEGTGWIADTPGFTSFYLTEWDPETLVDYYPEFAPYRGHCRFNDCHHLSEPGCAIKAAVETGEISSLRYESYQNLYKELKEQERMKKL